MTLARWVLIITGISFTGYGLVCAVDPVGVVGRFTGFGLEGDSAVVEALAMYGGLQVGFGLFSLWAAFKPQWMVPALTAIALVMGGLAIMRLTGISMHGAVGAHPGAAVYELLTAAFAIGALLMMRRAGVRTPSMA